MEKMSDEQLLDYQVGENDTVCDIIDDLLSTRAQLAALQDKAADYEKWMDADKLKLGTSVDLEKGTVMIICHPDDKEKFMPESPIPAEGENDKALPDRDDDYGDQQHGEEA